MPELPEVETIAKQLRPKIKSKQIKDIKIIDPKLKSKKLEIAIGKKINEVYRFGKQVVLELNNGTFLAIHLRMTGRLIIQSKILGKYYHDKASSSKHIRFKLIYDKGELDFVDPRRFGTIELLSSLHQKGIDPVRSDFTEVNFKKLILKNSQSLKNFLMRQDKIVGIGNIYASEILFDSKLKPSRKVDSLKQAEIIKLYRSIKKILNKAIKHCGTTFSDFQTTTGEIGSYQRFLKVYARQGDKCYICKSKIEKIVQQQRSTFFCPKCQK